MTRKRSTWNNRQADPYTMHQDRDHRPAEDYLIGDPSAFAEDVHDELPNDEALGRNEVGMPNMPASNMDHKDADKWNSDEAYDNSHTFSPEDRDGEEKLDTPIEDMNGRRMSSRDVYAALERKAYSCSRIAEALLPGAPESLLAQQTFELMSLPDNFVIATLQRIAESEEEDHKEDHKEEDKKEAGKEHKSEEDHKEEADEKKEAADCEDEDEKEEDEKKESMEKDEDEDSDKESKKASEVMSDLEVEMMMREMTEEEDVDAMMEEAVAAPMMEEATEFDIELDPTMDMVANQDETLNNLFEDTVPRASRQAGVQSLGHVKSASSAEGDLDDLSKLWKTDPDVSGSF